MNENAVDMAYRWVDGFDPETLWEVANSVGIKPTNDHIRKFITDMEQEARQTFEFAEIAAFLNAQADAEAAWEAFETAVSYRLDNLIRATMAVALEWALDHVVDDYRCNGGNGIVEYLADIAWECGDVESAISYLEGLSSFSTLPGLIYRYDVEEKAAEWQSDIEAFLKEYHEATGRPFTSDEDEPPIKAAVLWFASEIAGRLRGLVYYP